MDTNSQGRTTILLNEQNKVNKQMCPVDALWEYQKLRGSHTGPIFLFMDGSPVSRSFITQQLSLSLNWSDCNTKFYKAHSFKIGCATALAAEGMSLDEISRIGRWSSSVI